MLLFFLGGPAVVSDCLTVEVTCLFWHLRSINQRLVGPSERSIFQGDFALVGGGGWKNSSDRAMVSLGIGELRHSHHPPP